MWRNVERLQIMQLPSRKIVAVGMFNDQLVEIDRDMYEFMHAPENNQEPWEMGDTHEYIQGGLTYDKKQSFKSFQKKIKEREENKK